MYSLLFRCVSRALHNGYVEVEPILKRMICSEHADVQIAGGRQLCLASLFHKEAQVLLQPWQEKPGAVRRGIAEVCAVNVLNADYRAWCVSTLSELFNDADKAVRDEAAHVFWRMDKSRLAEVREMVAPFISSAAFEENHEHSFTVLDDSNSLLPKESLRASRLFLGAVGTAVSSISYSAFGTGVKVARIVLRVYQESSDSVVKSQCLDLIDQMTEAGVYELDKMLAVADRA